MAYRFNQEHNNREVKAVSRLVMHDSKRIIMTHLGSLWARYQWVWSKWTTLAKRFEQPSSRFWCGLEIFAPVVFKMTFSRQRLLFSCRTLTLAFLQGDCNEVYLPPSSTFSLLWHTNHCYYTHLILNKHCFLVLYLNYMTITGYNPHHIWSIKEQLDNSLTSRISTIFLSFVLRHHIVFDI